MAGEQLLSDERVDRCERNVRRIYPELPEDSAFVTWIVERQTKQHNGKEVKVPAMAMFAIVTPDPRPGHETDQIMNVGQMNLSQWLKVDKDYGRMVGYQDPALGAFRRVAAVHVSVLNSARELLPSDMRLAPKELLN